MGSLQTWLRLLMFVSMYRARFEHMFRSIAHFGLESQSFFKPSQTFFTPPWLKGEI